MDQGHAAQGAPRPRSAQAASLTLDALSAAVGIAPSRLSMFESGQAEPRLAQLHVLSTPIAALLSETAPDARSALEIDLERYQRAPLFADLGVPALAASRALPQAVLEALAGLHRELHRRAEQAIATPEEARRANTELRR